jgi:sugar/nucleoside kinase (ribokinase family)
MSQAKVDLRSQIVGIGHAMCDVSAELEPQAWNAFRMEFPWMTSGLPVHIDEARAHTVLSFLEKEAARGEGSLSYAAGGAALNAMRVASLLGAKASFVGVVGEDPCGDVVRAGLHAAGVEALLEVPAGSEGTGIFCTVRLVTSRADSFAERFVFASPAVARRVRDVDVDGFDLDHVAIIHAEGLLADSPRNLEALFRRARGMHAMVSLDAASSEATRRNRDVLSALIRQYADFVFCNKAEFEALNPSIQDYSPDTVWVIQRDRAGVDCRARGQTLHVDAPRCAVVDEVGAGDAFAGAFLAAHLAGKPLALCLELGTEAAACALQSRGPAPDEARLRTLFREFLAG